MPERVPERLHRKLRWVFVTQALIASLVLALGLIHGGVYLRYRMLQDRMQSESVHLWDAIDRDPGTRLSSAMGIESWLVPAGADDASLPAELRGLGSGFHRLSDGKRFAYVSERERGRLVLSLQPRDADHIVRATESGIHVYVIGGYGAHRLRPLVQLARARFGREQRLQAELLELSSRLEERKMVERAKGILMHARRVSDDDAFQILRTASMHSNQRLGQVSQHIIHSARFAEAVNRSGQLRMLSQRLVKLHLLRLAGVQAAQCDEQLNAAMQRVDANLALLEKNLSRPTYGDLLGQVVLTWTRLKHDLRGEPQASQIAQTDELAELLLQEAERLTGSLENASTVAPLHLLNVAGRQRMLSQRFAKYALLGLLGDGSLAQRCEAGMAESREAFEQTLRYLNGLPLTTQDIRVVLDAAGVGWLQMLAGAEDARRSSGAERLATLDRLAVASETLLDLFEQLSAHYEHSMQMLVGS